jgi:CheY-like chemotaxis protein
MKKGPLTCIMLIDNNADDNFYHKRVIKKTDDTIEVLVMSSASDALLYLQTENIQPDLILLDINMPGINGWDFMDRYQLISNQLTKPVLIMLTTSENPDDRLKALQSGAIADLMTKPLTADLLNAIKHRFFV